jgi:hypothetical protein
MIDEAEREFGRPQAWRVGKDRLFLLSNELGSGDDLVQDHHGLLCGLPVSVETSKPMLLELVTDRGIVPAA